MSTACSERLPHTALLDLIRLNPIGWAYETNVHTLHWFVLPTSSTVRPIRCAPCGCACVCKRESSRSTAKTRTKGSKDSEHIEGLGEKKCSFTPRKLFCSPQIDDYLAQSSWARQVLPVLDTPLFPGPCRASYLHIITPNAWWQQMTLLEARLAGC